MIIVLIPAWENSPKFLKLSLSDREEITRKLLYAQDSRESVPYLVRYAAGYCGVSEDSVYKVIAGKTFSKQIIEMLYILALRSIEEGIPTSAPLYQPKELTGDTLLAHYWGDDDEY